MLPIDSWSFDEATGTESTRIGAVGMTVDAGTGIVEQGWVSHPPADGADWPTSIRRSVVVGDTLFTLSDAGLQGADLTTLVETAWLPFR